MLAQGTLLTLQGCRYAYLEGRTGGENGHERRSSRHGDREHRQGEKRSRHERSRSPSYRRHRPREGGPPHMMRGPPPRQALAWLSAYCLVSEA